MITARIQRAQLSTWTLAGMLASFVLLAATAGLIGGTLVGVVILLIGATVLLPAVSLRDAVTVFICTIPFDLQRQVAGRWLYVDLLGMLLLVPLLRNSLPSKRAWLFVPYFLFCVATTITRII